MGVTTQDAFNNIARRIREEQEPPVNDAMRREESTRLIKEADIGISKIGDVWTLTVMPTDNSGWVEVEQEPDQIAEIEDALQLMQEQEPQQ